jgi:protein phosphatase
MNVVIPELCLVALVGPSSSGKSTFAAQHFRASEVLSSDAFRLMLADDENDQAITPAAFEALHFVAGKRLDGGRLTVVDATNLQPHAREELVRLARQHHVLPVAIAFDVSEEIIRERNAARDDRDVPEHSLRRQHVLFQRALKFLQKDGFRRVYVLRGEEEIAAATIERERLWTDRRDQHGPFDIVGDIHGCADELAGLLGKLGYEVDDDRASARHPEDRKAVFVGDLVDRGPDTPGVLRLVMGMVGEGTALCVPGNHDNKLMRALNGRKVQVSHGLAESLSQLETCSDEFRAEVVTFLEGLVSHAVLDDGRLVVAHAGLPERLHNRSSGLVRDFALYGQTTGETDEFGLPIRYAWANDYRGDAVVVYGHTPVHETQWVNNTICVDTGCVFGGQLSALRYPERELVSVPAARVYYEAQRPLVPDQAAPGQGDRGDMLDVEDVLGRRIVDTRLLPRITIEAQNSAAALEVMSRFAIDPRWLIYLPPTMAPTATSTRDGLLEHPAEAFAAFRHDGVGQVICEEKHMGSRAVVVVCRDAEVAARRFHGDGERAGVVYTRTGRPFFADEVQEAAVLDRVRSAIDGAGLWDELTTDWLALDCELMPWNEKAVDLLRNQYARVGAAGRAGLSAARSLLEKATARGVDLAEVSARTTTRAEMVEGFVAAYGHYCWPVGSVDDLRLAPFVVLAGESEAYATRDHGWHMQMTSCLAEQSDLVIATDHMTVDVTDADDESTATAWWDKLTSAGGEGMVIKPIDSVVHGTRGLVQPGIKCRGKEYLRIIYGPEYDVPENLTRLRKRGLGRKSSLARREFALGIEALERFARGEPLHRVHECVFGVLALESEPVDPRL